MGVFLKKIISFLLLISNFCSAESLIWYHSGGKPIDHQRLTETIENVLGSLPAGKIPGMQNLVRETLAIESHSGTYSYEKAAKNWRNYGIAQIRIDTAEW